MRIEPLSSDFRETSYDLFIGSVGFERRSSYIAASIQASRGVGIAFPYHQVLDFASNQTVFGHRGFKSVVLEDDEIFSAITEIISGMGGVPLRVAIDVSSFSRRRIADVFAAALEMLVASSRVDILYSVAAFTAPAETVGTYEVGPVSPRLAGWFAEPEMPLSLVVGVGYEVGAALGAKQYLDPSRWWVFEPNSINEEYRAAVRDANEGLWEQATTQSQVVNYDIGAPVQTYAIVDALVSKVAEVSRVVLMPLGPKIFAAIAILLGFTRTDVSVWRVTEGRGAIPIQRVPTGTVVGLSVVI